jgi:hypothetical protein
MPTEGFDWLVRKQGDGLAAFGDDHGQAAVSHH